MHPVVVIVEEKIVRNEDILFIDRKLRENCSDKEFCYFQRLRNFSSSIALHFVAHVSVFVRMN